MPKAFLMSGKKRKPIEILYQNEQNEKEQRECDEQSSESPGSFTHEVSDYGSQRSPSSFSPSAASAFSKIDKTEPDISGVSRSLYHPGLFPTTLFPYAFAAFRNDSASDSLRQGSRDTYLYPSLTVTGSDTIGEKSPASSPEKNMYYYVDPRIPFTNYFLNLTRLLSTNNANKTCSSATPLAKVANENRADDREDSTSPNSQKPSPGSVSVDEGSSVKCMETSIEKEFKETRSVDKYHIPAYPDPHIPNPYSSLLHTAAQSALLPLHSGGIFHPAMMQVPGTGFRRLNPEKPPPVKKYKCDVCGKAFSRSNTLVTHKRIHTGDKPFKCEICSRAFRQPGNLTRHRLTHTTVKPYVCPTCHKAFNRASNLHTHMRTHTSFKAFVCPFCGKGFHQKIDMKIHCYTHTGRTDTSQM